MNYISDWESLEYYFRFDNVFIPGVVKDLEEKFKDYQVRVVDNQPLDPKSNEIYVVRS